MTKRVITLDVEDTNLTKTAGSKNTAEKKTVSQKETEMFGIVEINNAQAKSKIKKSAERGFEKHQVEAKKKGVKANLNKVDDYFDFSFRPTQKVAAKPVEPVAKKVCKTEAKPVVDREVIKEKTKAQAVTIRAELDAERGSNVTAEASERYFDEDATRIITVARIGALFGCDKRMIN